MSSLSQWFCSITTGLYCEVFEMPGVTAVIHVEMFHQCHFLSSTVKGFKLDYVDVRVTHS